MNYLVALIAILIISSVRTDLNVGKDIEMDTNFENINNDNKTDFNGTNKDDDPGEMRHIFDHILSENQNTSNLNATTIEIDVKAQNLDNNSNSSNLNDSNTNGNLELNETDMKEHIMSPDVQGRSNLELTGNTGLVNEFDDDVFSLRSDFVHLTNDNNQDKGVMELNLNLEKDLIHDTNLKNDFVHILNEDLNKSNLESNGTITGGNENVEIKEKVLDLVKEFQDNVNQKFLLFRENLRNILDKQADSSKAKNMH